MSESPASDEGGIGMAICNIRILVGARTTASGTWDSERDGAAEVDIEEAAFPLPFPFPVGADTEGNFGIATCDGDDSSLRSSAWFSIWLANADSFSPTQAFANHLPPAIPRISRFAVRQWRTFAPLRSRGVLEAKPEPTLGGGRTGKGFVGRG